MQLHSHTFTAKRHGMARLCGQTSFSLTLCSSLPTATGAGPHQPVHLQLTRVYGRAGAGEHAEAPGSRDLHADTAGRQWSQQRGWVCQVSYYDFNHLYSMGLFQGYMWFVYPYT